MMMPRWSLNNDVSTEDRRHALVSHWGNFQILMLSYSLSPFFVSYSRRDSVVYCHSSYVAEFVTLVAKYRS